MRKGQKDIQLPSYNELLGIDDFVNHEADQIVEVPLSELHPFKDHPFQVRDDEKMEETVESIRNYGVLNPGLVRPRAEGGYEIVAGHRRKRGCELAGKPTMPVLVRDYTDDEAVVIMVDSNIQRENILPSEKAFAYRMKLEAMKHQGAKGNGDTADLVGKEAGDSGRKVQRYIRLTELLPELLEMVDDGKVKFIPAVSLSFLSKEEQSWVFRCIIENSISVSGAMADAMKKYSENGKLTEIAVQLILCEEKKDTGKVTIPANRISRYFPKDYSKQQMEQVIFELLEDWKEKSIKREGGKSKMAKYNVEFDYFHDYESEQFAFYRIPKVLFTDDYFRNLSSDAKVLYGLMLDRMALSIKNKWVDEDGRVYIIFYIWNKSCSI